MFNKILSIVLVRVVFFLSSREEKKIMVQALIYYSAKRGVPISKSMLRQSIGKNDSLRDELISELIDEDKVIGTISSSGMPVFVPIARLP